MVLRSFEGVRGGLGAEGLAAPAWFCAPDEQFFAVAGFRREWPGRKVAYSMVLKESCINTAVSTMEYAGNPDLHRLGAVAKGPGQMLLRVLSV